MSHFFAIKALPWLLPHLQRHPHWSNSSRWQEVIGSCRWAKTLLLARRLISFRCVIVCYYLANPYFLCACYAGQNKWKIQFTVKLPLPKKIIRGPLRMDTQVLLHCGIYLSEWFGFLCTRDFMRSFWFWSWLSGDIIMLLKTKFIPQTSALVYVSLNLI